MDFDLTSSYDYELPPELVADHPAAQRSASRLLVGDVQNATSRHHVFGDLVDILDPGDLLVFNDTRVVPARMHVRKQTGGAVELFVTDVVSAEGPDRWTVGGAQIRFRCMTRASKPLRSGQTLSCEQAEFTVVEAGSGSATVSVDTTLSPADFLRRVGEIPLPPYIVKRRSDQGQARAVTADAERYQTVYANKPGAVAAPTAGLHFDEGLLDALSERGVRQARVTLEVGPGTFRPVSTERLTEHPMHTENYQIDAELGPAIAATRDRGGRVVAVGTTTVRALEAEARDQHAFQPGPRQTDIFIKPGFQFQVVDAMITNFHLPRSTLLALVFAFGGADFMRSVYATAVAKRYRFYSYGDAMLLGRDL